MARKSADRSPSREANDARRGPQRSPLYKGLAKATFSIRPDQLAALRAEVRRRADAAGTCRPDASEVAREAIDSWLKAR